MSTAGRQAGEPPLGGSSFPSTTCAGGRPRRATTPPDPTTPQLVGYDDLTLIGEGGMGVVYRGQDRRLKRTVALKMIKSDMLSPDRLVRFVIEAEALARLQHPHIVQVFAREEHAGQPVLVLEYVGGGTLEPVVASGPLRPREAARLLATLARAVAAAHEAGVIHRDLKPGNVLLAPPVAGNSGTVCGGFPKVSDFGLAQLADAGLNHTTQGMVMGTPAYMAPEQAAGLNTQIGPPADVWALGVILYRCLTGRLPFDADSPATLIQGILTETPDRPRALQPGIPREMEEACLACLTRNPGERPTAAGLAIRLERFLANGDGTTVNLAPQPRARSAGQATTTPPAQRPRPRPSVWRRPLVAGALAAVVLGAGLGAVGSLLTRPRPAAPPAGPGGPESLRVVALRVSEDGTDQEYGVTAPSARPWTGVRVRAELSHPAHAYLIGYDTQGGEQLLWPPQDDRPPPREAVLQVPAEGRPAPVLCDGPPGMWAVALVASARHLPPFREFQRQRTQRAWQHIPPAPGVLVLDGESVTGIAPGMPPDPFPGPVSRGVRYLGAALRSAEPALVVSAVVVPVWGPRGRPPR